MTGVSAIKIYKNICSTAAVRVGKGMNGRSNCPTFQSLSAALCNTACWSSTTAEDNSAFHLWVYSPGRPVVQGGSTKSHYSMNSDHMHEDSSRENAF